MLTALVVIGIIGYVFAVPSPDKPEAPTVEHHHHHHHRIVIEREIRLKAQIALIKTEMVFPAEGKEMRLVRLPEARLLPNASTAIERYRSHERKPS